MCECGCPETWTRYRFPAPNGSFYVLTLMGTCTNCDGASGFRIELCKPGSHEYEYYTDDCPDAIDGELHFTKPHGCVHFDTGVQKHKFVESLLSHLVGVDSREMGEDGVIDKYGAEVILEEMYEDSQVKPTMVQ